MELVRCKMTDDRRLRTSCKIPAGLALVERCQFLVFAVQEFAFVASKTTPRGVVVPTNPSRFRSRGSFHRSSSHSGWGHNAAAD